MKISRKSKTYFKQFYVFFCQYNHGRAFLIFPKKGFRFFSGFLCFILWYTHTCACQGVRNDRFSENLACFVVLWHLFLRFSFCLITVDVFSSLLTRSDVTLYVGLGVLVFFLFIPFLSVFFVFSRKDSSLIESNQQIRNFCKWIIF